MGKHKMSDYNIKILSGKIARKRAAAKALIIAATSLLLESQKKQRRWWVRPWLEEKNKSALELVKNEFQTDSAQFRRFLRMTEPCFNKLLHLLKPQLEKKNTNFRNAITARDKLIITLRFLATGETYRSLMYTFRISESTISLFIPEVCRAIYYTLKAEYLKTPNTAAEWLNISNDFQELWNIPNVIGAMDGKHIVFRAPTSDGSTYYNYKGSHSIVLLAMVDAKYNFIYVDVGVNGRVSDGGVFRQSSLSKAKAHNALNIPGDRNLPQRKKPVPHVILADAAFPLGDHILKPFPFRNMTNEQRIFNYRLSRGRRVVENAFGILANRFRIFLTTTNLSPEKVQDITLACCVLHNFIRAEIPRTVEEDFDKSHTFKFGLSQQHGNQPKQSCLSIREEFKDYFVNEGAVPWQDDKV